MEGRPRLVPTATPARPARVRPGCRSWAGPRWTRVGGCLRTRIVPLSSLDSGSGVRAGGRQVAVSLRVPSSATFWLQLMAFPGCLEVPWVGALAERPEKCPWLPGWASLRPRASVLPPSSLAPGRTAPPTGLLWSQRLVLGFISLFFPWCG